MKPIEVGEAFETKIGSIVTVNSLKALEIEGQWFVLINFENNHGQKSSLNLNEFLTLLA